MRFPRLSEHFPNPFMQIANMKDANNDNEPNPWSTIGLQAALIVNRLRCQSQILQLQTDEPENAKPDAEQNSDRATKRDDETKRADMERRIRDLLAMENRLRRQSIK